MGEQSRSPGWYDAPDGVVELQAYWNGREWTGQTRRRPDPFQHRMAGVVVGVILGPTVLGLAWWYLVGTFIVRLGIDPTSARWLAVLVVGVACVSLVSVPRQEHHRAEFAGFAIAVIAVLVVFALADVYTAIECSMSTWPEVCQQHFATD